MTKEEFKILFDLYFDNIRSYLFYRGAGQDEASDLAQDVFMRVWEKQMNIDKKTAIRLLYKIAHDMFISKYRRNKLEMNFRNSVQSSMTAPSPEEQMQYNELYKSYQNALAGLDEKKRTVFMMAKIDGLKYFEIAERLDISIKAVEKRMSLTLEYFRKALHTK